MEEKILFEVKTTGDGTRVACSADGMEENFKLAVAIHELLERSPGVAFFLMAIHANPELLEKAGEEAVDIPDFNEILKNIK